MTSESDDFLINSFQPLVYKTLSRLNISQSNLFFEDYVQELTIHLLSLQDSFKQDVFESDKNRFKFTSYAAKGLYWFALNLIRSNKIVCSYTSAVDDMEYYINKKDTQKTPNSNLHITDFLRQAEKRLTVEDYRLLIYISEDVYTPSEIATMMGISRSTFYERKQKIQLRLKDLRRCLL